MLAVACIQHRAIASRVGMSIFLAVDLTRGKQLDQVVVLFVVNDLDRNARPRMGVVYHS